MTTPHNPITSARNAGVLVHKANADLFAAEVERIEMRECQAFFVGYDAGDKAPSATCAENAQGDEVQRLRAEMAEMKRQWCSDLVDRGKRHREDQAENAALKAEVERLHGDKARLDFLDECNAALNKRAGTVYGWEMVMNHAVNRLMTEKYHLAVDLNDQKAGGAKSCRIAIDREMSRISALRAHEQKGGV